jgi:hypothetical protein
MVLSKGCEVVGPGYSRLSRDAARVTNRGGESGNPNRVDRVHREYDTDQRIDRITRDSRGNRDGQGNRDRNPKSGNSSRVTENSVTIESRGMEKSANTESWVTEKSANTESRVMENSANMKNWVMQDLGSRKLEEGKGSAPSKRPAPLWYPRDITKTQKCRLQKMRQRELAEKKKEEERDYWFNCLRP